jgi:hypothetical protein
MSFGKPTVPTDIRGPILSYEDLRRAANDFLMTYHPSQSLPVPIEEIIDLELKINIIPVPGLQQEIEMDAFISSDCTEITVDEFVYRKRLNRYRFSLAHELGHKILHRSIYCLMAFRTIAGWVAFLQACPPDQHSWLEYQARSFAGLVLVPKDLLERETDTAVQMARQSGINVHTRNQVAWESIAEYLATRFVVSKDVIMKRLAVDRIGTARWLRSRKYL